MENKIKNNAKWISGIFIVITVLILILFSSSCLFSKNQALSQPVDTDSLRNENSVSGKSAAKTSIPAEQTHPVGVKPFPYNIDYPGCIKPNHITQNQINRSVIDYFNYWKISYVRESNGNTPGGGFYVESDSIGWHQYPAKSNSEAHGFGMIIFALMGEKNYFDGFFNMYDKHRSILNKYNMSWVIAETEYTSQDSDSATDGDMDIAYSLLLAHDKWGSGGAINYLDQAKKMITFGLKQGDMSITSKRTKLGDWSESMYESRSSDWMLGHMQAYYNATKDQFWLDSIKTITNIMSTISVKYSPDTGLMPDFILDNPPKPANPGFLESKYDGEYYYNACRVPFRISMDYAMTGSADSKKAVTKIITWLKIQTAQDPNKIKSGYTLSGSVLPDSNYFSTAFAAPFISACVVDKSHQEYLNAGWDVIKNKKESYYEDTLNLICMLFISGNWWSPGSQLETD